jgi:serine protease Do
MKDKIFCTYCGEELDLDTNFCSECGKEIVKKEEPKKRGRKKKVEETPVEKVKVEEPNVERVELGLTRQEILEDELILKERELRKIKRGRFLSPILSCVITFIICLAAFGLFYEYYLKNMVIETTKREVTVTDKGISEAVEKVYDSVVVVESYYKNKLYSTGTGFVYQTKDDKAYILTNHHVIENSDEVRVVFTNNEKEKVVVLGSDKYSDVAVLSVDKDKIISVAELGSSEKLKVGDTAFAVGAPLDSSTYAWTVTRGIISGKDREVATQQNVMKVLQTDTAINSGNSGGPLCNSNGEVIGITNMKLASSSIEGMGFAIPIETAIKNAQELMEGKEVQRPYLGVEIGQASESYYSDETYVYINKVEDDGSAYKAGLKAGDIILKVNDVEVDTIVHFQYELYKYKIGEKIKMTVKRNGEEKTLVVKLGTKNKEA